MTLFADKFVEKREYRNWDTESSLITLVIICQEIEGEIVMTNSNKDSSHILAEVWFFLSFTHKRDLWWHRVSSRMCIQKEPWEKNLFIYSLSSRAPAAAASSVSMASTLSASPLCIAASPTFLFALSLSSSSSSSSFFSPSGLYLTSSKPKSLPLWTSVNLQPVLRKDLVRKSDFSTIMQAVLIEKKIDKFSGWKSQLFNFFNPHPGSRPKSIKSMNLKAFSLSLVKTSSNAVVKLRMASYLATIISHGSCSLPDGTVMNGTRWRPSFLSGRNSGLRSSIASETFLVPERMADGTSWLSLMVIARESGCERMKFRRSMHMKWRRSAENTKLSSSGGRDFVNKLF